MLGDEETLSDSKDSLWVTVSLRDLSSALLRDSEDSAKPTTSVTIVNGSKSQISGGDVHRVLVNHFDAAGCMLDRPDWDAWFSFKPLFLFSKPVGRNRLLAQRVSEGDKSNATFFSIELRV
jgi:hypothetical protein